MLKYIDIKKINFALIVLLIGLIIRFFYQEKYTVMLFQHDWQGHIEMIKYLADTWSIPLPNKGLEFPQQPLYYVVTAGIYSFATSLGSSDKMALEYIGYFSFICSTLFLVYAYKFVALLSKSKRVQTIAMIFLALTPSIVYISARINNDSMVMALASMSLYYVVKSYQSDFKESFFVALLVSSLLFLTKISALSIELLFFALLILSYRNSLNQENNQLKQKIYIFGLTGMFLLTYTLWRVYLPLDNSFHMVNSSGAYPGQILPPLDLHYFGTFNIFSLFEQSYSYVFGEDSVRYSFLTYQYGTMLFGEFDYTFFINKAPYMREIMQSILLLGLLFMVGFLIFIFQLYKASSLKKILFATLLINFLLIVKFMFDFPSVCNTDFRYFVPSFLLFAYMFAQGIHTLHDFKLLSKIINGLLSLLVLAEVTFFSLLIFY